mmetsp:Transcript_16955/g.45991  ORF Transcript_16955/g.45991 Transcript_16955/m.45991 type:complete len:110 (-) Transcript_16955:79-408(-)
MHGDSATLEVSPPASDQATSRRSEKGPWARKEWTHHGRLHCACLAGHWSARGGLLVAVMPPGFGQSLHLPQPASSDIWANFGSIEKTHRAQNDRPSSEATDNEHSQNAL